MQTNATTVLLSSSLYLSHLLSSLVKKNALSGTKISPQQDSQLSQLPRNLVLIVTQHLICVRLFLLDDRTCMFRARLGLDGNVQMFRSAAMGRVRRP